MSRDDDPADSIGRGLSNAFGGVSDLMGSWGEAMETNPGVRSMTKWGSFIFVAVLAWDRIGSLLDSMMGPAFDFPGGNILKNLLTIGLALSLASGVSSWIANSRDISELPEYIGEGFTDTFGMVGNLFGGAVSGISGMFNGGSGASTSVAVTHDDQPLQTVQLTPEMLAQYAEAYDDPASIGNEIGNATLPGPLIAIDERISALNTDLASVREAAEIEHEGSQFEVRVEGEGDEATYTYVPITTDASGTRAEGDAVEITEGQYEALALIGAQLAQLDDLAGDDDLHSQIDLYNDTAENYIQAYYDLQEKLTAEGIDMTAAEFDEARFAVNPAGGYTYTPADGGTAISITAAEYTGIMGAARAMDDAQSTYDASYESVMNFSDLPVGSMEVETVTLTPESAGLSTTVTARRLDLSAAAPA